MAVDYRILECIRIRSIGHGKVECIVKGKHVETKGVHMKAADEKLA